MNDFLALLKPRLAISRRYAFEMWQDEKIVVGEDWHYQIDEALRVAHLGVLLLTPDFLASSFITTEELPAFLGREGQAVPGKRVVPVAIKQLKFRDANLRGLERRQIYRDVEGRAFVEMSGYARDGWVDGFVTQLHDLLDRYACEANDG